MKITLEDIRKISDPYQVFLDSLSNHHTHRKYKSYLSAFLDEVPIECYQDILGMMPLQEPSNLAHAFLEVARKNPEYAIRIVAAFVKGRNEMIKQGHLASSTLPNHVKPIKALLDANGVALHWKSIYKMYPRTKCAANDRAYTKEELQKMILVADDISDKMIIMMFSSGGFRLESWDHFTWKDLIFFHNADCSVKGAALLVYRGDPESYWTFLTPECCNTILSYREYLKIQMGEYQQPDDPLLMTTRYNKPRRLNSLGVKRRVEKLAKKIGLRPSLPVGKKRHEVQLDHGFRKYFNTMMRRAKVSYLDKEDMLGHKVGLERHYERYREEDFERFSEYQKAIPFLTIFEEEHTSFGVDMNKNNENPITKENAF